MIWLYIFIAVAIMLAMILIGGSFYMFSFAIVRKKELTLNERVAKARERYDNVEGKSDWADRIEKGVNGLLECPLEDVYTESFDGLKLHGYWLPCEGASKSIIFCHGWRSSGLYDFSCIWEYYRSRGFNILIFDHRAHGKSEGKYICYGVKERFDLINWCKWVNIRVGNGKKIFLSGISMGSATVMMAIGTEGLPENVVGASLDCGYTSVEDIFRHVLKQDFHLPAFPILQTAGLISKCIAHFDFNEFSAKEGLENAKIPVVFIHGNADDFVPVEHTHENMKHCTSPHTYILVDNAEHGMSYFTDQAGVTAALEELLSKVFEDFQEKA